MAIRIKVRDATTKVVLDMELEPEATVQQIIKGAATYWGKAPTGYVIRREREIFRPSLTLVEARIADLDLLDFLTEEEATKPVLVLDAGAGRSLSIENPGVLGRNHFQGLVGNSEDAAKVSNRHLTVSYQAGIYILEDGAGGQASRNGTTLNGVDLRGRGRVPVRDGDLLRIAGVLSVTVRIVRGG